ncbi:helix-turn-helix domain-containing protein [Bacillus massiliigorillae]|uniref:helix-turn-helix domain-containing protein n=1 Tax=Bacillus massiliigorillae TaxID=1243664 RepID=UPI00039B619E|nr:XRE family transcriptional regulator [Bacillus massiliigorillae]
MEPIQETIANNLAKLRKSRALSLDQVAELTGVSKAMIAQIEKGKSNPTVTTLWKIANGLQVSFSVFMKEEDKPVVTKININELTPMIDDDGNYLVYSVFPYNPEKKFEIYTVNLQAGHSHRANQHLGEEYILMKSGTLTLRVQDEEYILLEGEAISFTANIVHSYINATDEMVSFYNVIYYPD